MTLEERIPKALLSPQETASVIHTDLDQTRRLCISLIVVSSCSCLAFGLRGGTFLG